VTNIKSLTLASAAALVALTAMATVPTTASAEDAKVHCYGVNSCKGESDCKSGNHECKGENSCKGEGFKALTKADCTAQHGSLKEPKPAAAK
jgi:hypothetical protein